MIVHRKKVCFIGSDGVGKTSIILRYTKNTFSNSYLMTLGCDFYDVAFEEDENKLSVFIWDIASQKNFEKMRSYYLSYTNLTVIVVDVNRTEPEYIDPWIEDVKKFCETGAPFLIALNKIDLLDESALKKTVASLKQKYGVPVYSTSAKTGENVRPLFDDIGKLLWDF